MQFVVLLQFAERGNADQATLAAILPGANQRDHAQAVQNLLDQGMIHRPFELLHPRDDLVAGSQFHLSPLGLRRLTSSD